MTEPNLCEQLEQLAEDNPKEPYGDVPYADPGYQKDNKKRYPIDTEEHVRAAWSYINMPKNREFYTDEQLKEIEDKIKQAAKEFGIDISEKENAEEESEEPNLCEELETLARGEGQGVGGERQGDGGASVCVCPDCGYEMPHEKGTPCSEQTCPKCNTPMQGK